MRAKNTISDKLPIIVGLTGGVGSGKSVIAAEFASRGALVISGDEVGHDVVKKNKSLQRRLAQAFGADILANGTIDRRLLASRAFASRKANSRLNEMVHPVLIKELNRRISRALGQPEIQIIVVDAALLVEWGMQVPVDFLVAVQASRARRTKWLRKRGWSKQEILDRMSAQLPFSARAALADHVIRNDGGLEALRRKAGRVWQNLLDGR